MGTLGQDSRFAVRMLVKNPTFTIAALLCLALGIGANTAIFSVVNAVLLRPLPFTESSRLVTFRNLEEPEEYFAFAPAAYLDLRNWSESVRDLAGHRSLNLNLSGSGVPERVRAQSVSPEFFRVFGVEPVLGRFFQPDVDPAVAGTRSVVLSYASWQARFGGDASVIDRALVLNGEPHTIVGVAPRFFDYPSASEMWVRSYRYGVPEPPVNLGDDLSSVRDLGYFEVVGRLADGVSFEVARAETDVIARRLAELRGDESGAAPFGLMALHEHLVGDVRPALLVLLGAVGFVLLIACANVANLLLARASTREREVAVRAALGAGRRRLVRQLLTENVLLGVLGGVIGLLLALWGVDVLVRLAPSGVPRLAEVGIDEWVLAFALGIAFATGLGFGVLPAFQASSPDIQASLKEGGRAASEGARRRRLRAGLIVSEVALSMVLVCGAALLTKTLLRLQAVDVGFRPENLLVMRMSLPETRYPGEAQMAAFVRGVIGRVRVLPGVSTCGMALAYPFSGMAATLSFTIPGRSRPPQEELAAEYQVVTPEYFEAMGIPLIRGRTLSETDAEDAPRVVVINEALARWQWPNEDPIGQRISIGGEANAFEIVGVMGDVRHFRYDQAPRPEVYASFYQDPWPFMAMVVRSEADPRGLVETIRREVLAVDADQPVYAVSTMEQVLSDSLQARRFTVQLMLLFAAIASVLALVGVYGVVSYLVSQRIHEIGIRMALGAQRPEVLRFVLAWGFRLVLTGTLVGLVLAVALGRSISGLLYGVSPADPAIFVGVTLVLLVAAGAATYVPARRASRVDPLVALRHE